MKKSFPVLTSGRLTLRKLSQEYVDDVFFLRSDAAVLKYIDREPETRSEAAAWIERVVGQIENGQAFQWMLVPQGSRQAIGMICFWNLEPERNKAELGYVLHPGFHGQGWMQEALNLVMGYGFKTLGLEIVEAITHRDNLKSRALLERNGFRRDDALERQRKAGGEEPEHATVYVRIAG